MQAIEEYAPLAESLVAETKPPIAAVLNDRLSTYVRIACWFAAISIPAVTTAAGFFLIKIIDHGERLAAIQATLNMVVEEQKKAVPKTVQSLLINPTQGKLEAAAAILESARKQQRQSDPSSLLVLSKSLLDRSALKDFPAYWGLASALIDYRSISPAAAHLPSCLSMGDPKMTLLAPMNATQTYMEVSNGIYQDCEITLDDPGVQQIYLRLFRMKDLELRDCIVHYHGGPLLFPVAVAPGKGPPTIIFVNCAFDFSAPGPPPDTGKRFLLAILGAETSNRIEYTFG